MSGSRSIVAVPALALAAILLAGCTPGAPDPEPSEVSTLTPAGSPTPDPAPLETGTTEPDAELRANVIDAVSSGNTAAIEGYLAATVHLTYCASESEGDVNDPRLVVDSITSLTPPSATWDFDLPASKLDTYANDPGHYPSYADDFPAGAIVGLSSARTVVSFVASGSQITRVFLCTDEYALTFTT